MKEMTPTELLALAREASRLTGKSGAVASALRSYAELVSALHYFNDNYIGGVAMRDAVLTPEEIVSWARGLGWKGLEEQ